MSEKFPDNWVVLKITHHGKTIYKVLGGWSGGYLGSDCWQLNSGIVKVEESDLCWTFHGVSGSQYVCHKKTYGLRVNNAGIYNRLKEKVGDAVTMLDKTTDWNNLV